MSTSRRTALSWLVAAPLVAGAVRAGDAQTGPAPGAVRIPAGPFLMGSTRAERDAAYALDRAAYGHDRTRELGWYEVEQQLAEVTLPAFAIMRTTVTNRAYAAFVRDTGHRVPDVDPETWAGYGLIHPWGRTRRHAWTGDAWPEGRGDHPVVMVSHDDARAYADWLSEKAGARWRLPTEAEWEKAARGTDGRMFPWGDRWAPERLNSHDAGPFDTTPVGHYPDGVSPFGLLDPAGNVFEWTATPGRAGRFIVKGGSWDDRGCGVCRPAARHGRPEGIRHILVGFRLVRDSR